MCDRAFNMGYKHSSILFLLYEKVLVVQKLFLFNGLVIYFKNNLFVQYASGL